MPTLKNNSGQMIVLLMGILIPFLLLGLAMVIDIGILTNRRIRLQTAVDLAAYAGASVLSQDLTALSREMTSLEDRFDQAVQNTQNAFPIWGGNFNVAQSQGMTDRSETANIRNTIGNINTNAYPASIARARQIFVNNINWIANPLRNSLISAQAIRLDFFYPPLGTNGQLLDLDPPQTVPLNYQFTNSNPWDPTGTGQVTFQITQPVSNLGPQYNNRRRFAFVVQGTVPLLYNSLVNAIATLLPGSSSFGAGPNQPVQAVAAAQPYGGTLRDRATNRSRLPPSPGNSGGQGDNRRIYRPSLISFWDMIFGPFRTRYFPLLRVNPVTFQQSANPADAINFPGGQTPPY